MPQITNFTIHQFRGIKNLTLQDLSNVNILVGANNSGKTTILEAIEIYCHPLQPLILYNTSRRREIKSSRQSILDTIKWIFPINDNKEIIFTSEGDFPLRKYQATYQEFLGINPENQENLDTEKCAELILKAEANHQIKKAQFKMWENESFIDKQNYKYISLPVVTVTSISHKIEQLQVRGLSATIFQDFQLEIIELLQIFEPEITDIEILALRGDTPEIYINHQQLGKCPLSIFGEGIKHLLYIAVNLVKAQNGILLIDELEIAIHTGILTKSFSWLVQWCTKLNIQMFVTTHSLETIDSLLDATELNPNLTLYRLEKKSAQIKVVKLDREILSIIRDELGQEVRK